MCVCVCVCVDWLVICIMCVVVMCVCHVCAIWTFLLCVYSVNMLNCVSEDVYARVCACV